MNPMEFLMFSASRLRGPFDERRRADDSGNALLMRILDEVDYGLLLLTVTGELCYANQLALQEIGGSGPLREVSARLQTQPEGELGALRAALVEAMHGRRSLVTLGHNGHTLLVAVIPIAAGADTGPDRHALLVFNKRASCAALTIDFYARSNGLTATESAVLLRLSEGLKPKDIARIQGVALSTVRSQISSIRSKTRTASIGELAARVAGLPPFAPALKSVSAHPGRGATPQPAAGTVLHPCARSGDLRSVAYAAC